MHLSYEKRCQESDALEDSWDVLQSPQLNGVIYLSTCPWTDKYENRVQARSTKEYRIKSVNNALSS